MKQTCSQCKTKNEKGIKECTNCGANLHKQNIAAIILVVISFSILALIFTCAFNDDDDNNTLVEEDTTIVNDPVQEKRTEAEQIQFLTQELSSINDTIEFDTYKTSLDGLTLELALFGYWGKVISESVNYNNTTIDSLSTQLSTAVTEIQLKEFPLLRKTYAKFMSDALWENDIKVFTTSKSNKHINLTGGVFAANKNKLDFQNKLVANFRNFRFKKANYRWYKGDSDYTTFEIDSKEDSELLIYN